MENLEYFVEYGNKAPSSHNAKMWKVEIDSIENKIIIALNYDSLLSEVDPLNREAWISMGAFTQNIILIASDFGYGAKATLDNGIVEIKFKRSSKKESYKSLLDKRRTIRKAFKTIPITQISNIVKGYSNAIYIPRDTPYFDTLVQLSRQANEQQMNDYRKRKELAEWINFKENKETGMNLKNIGMNAFERFAFRNFIGRKGFVNSSMLRKSIIKNLIDYMINVQDIF